MVLGVSEVLAQINQFLTQIPHRFVVRKASTRASSKIRSTPKPIGNRVDGGRDLDGQIPVLGLEGGGG